MNQIPLNISTSDPRFLLARRIVMTILVMILAFSSPGLYQVVVLNDIYHRGEHDTYDVYFHQDENKSV